jgi:hypothetical protein
MSHKLIEILAEISKLANALPADPAEYSELSAKKRRVIRGELESAIVRLSSVTQSLDMIRQPKHVFDPTSPKVIGKMVADALLLQDKESLADAVKHSFYGAGVYAVYYHGPFDCYGPIADKDHPIYVGKADPDALHALTPQEQGLRLFTRLKDHNRSLANAENLMLSDFDCRYLVVRSAWVETAEDLLIDWFKPVWNNELKVCYGFGKHGDSAGTRSNERSPWDTLHPGRAWAKSNENTPNKKSVAQIRADIAEHFKKYPPQK